MRSGRKLFYLFNSQSTLTNRTYNAHIDRVLSDGGVIPDTSLLKQAVKFLLKRPLSEYAVIADANIFGYKLGVDNSHVSKLYSLIPGSDLVQTVGANQPAISQENGRYVITTDGVDDRMATVNIGLIRPNTIYLPVNILSQGTAARTLFDGINGFNTNAFRIGSNSANYFIYSGTALNSSGLTFGTRQLHTLVFNNTDSYIGLNGVQKAVGSAGNSASQPNGLAIGAYSGGTDPVNAILSTIIATKTADIPTQRANMEAFINELNGGIY